MSSLRSKSEDGRRHAITTDCSAELGLLAVNSAKQTPIDHPNRVECGADSASKSGILALEVALNTIAAASNATTLSELNVLFRPAVQALGFSSFASVKLARPSGRTQASVLFGDGIEGWIDHYLKKGCTKHDLVIERCFKTTEPFCWHDVRCDGSAAAGHSSETYEEAYQAGVAAPVRKPDGSVLVVLFVGQVFDGQDPVVFVASHLLASYYGIAGGHLYAADQLAAPRQNQLTDRQVECLKWIRAGKTSAEISDLVGISARVVNEHVWGACRRLGVRTRAQAVLAASSAGFLD